MKKEGNKKMPTPRHKVIHNPIPTSLFSCLFVVNALGKEKSKNILTSNCPLKYIVAVKETKM